MRAGCPFRKIWSRPYWDLFYESIPGNGIGHISLEADFRSDLWRVNTEKGVRCVVVESRDGVDARYFDPLAPCLSPLPHAQFPAWV